MNSKSKALIVMLCAIVVVAAAVFGTLAYLTDTDAATNTFTVGKVGITLDEAKVNTDGSYVTDAQNRVQENKYHLLPGQTYIKDPTIHVDADSEDCYLFVKVENGIKEIEGAPTVEDQMKTLGWEALDGVENVYVFVKDETMYEKYAISKSGNVVVFDKFSIDGDKVVNVPEKETVPEGKFDIAAYKDEVIKVTAYAVQKAGFEDTDPADIWAAAFPANP